jgi:hypothetical protein
MPWHFCAHSGRPAEEGRPAPMAIGSKGGRPVGLRKTGGRKKGTPNHDTLALTAKLDAISCDPLMELAKIGMNKKNPIEIRVRCFSELASYMYPKRKPVDDSIDQPMVTNVITKLDSSSGSSNVGDQPNSQA